LQSTNEDFTQAQAAVVQKDDEIRNLQIELAMKDGKIKQQNDDLQEFGKMKKRN